MLNGFHTFTMVCISIHSLWTFPHFVMLQYGTEIGLIVVIYGWHFPPSMSRCSVMQPDQQFEKMRLADLTRIGWGTCYSSPSPVDSCHMIWERWLLVGNWQDQIREKIVWLMGGGQHVATTTMIHCDRNTPHFGKVWAGEFLCKSLYIVYYCLHLLFCFAWLGKNEKKDEIHWERQWPKHSYNPHNHLWLSVWRWPRPQSGYSVQYWNIR